MTLHCSDMRKYLFRFFFKICANNAILWKRAFKKYVPLEVWDGRSMKNRRKVTWVGVNKKVDFLTQIFSVFISPTIQFFVVSYLMGGFVNSLITQTSNITTEKSEFSIHTHSYTETRLKPTNCLSVFDHSVVLAPKGIISHLIPKRLFLTVLKWLNKNQFCWYNIFLFGSTAC